MIRGEDGDPFVSRVEGFRERVRRADERDPWRLRGVATLWVFWVAGAAGFAVADRFVAGVSVDFVGVAPAAVTVTLLAATATVLDDD